MAFVSAREIELLFALVVAGGCYGDVGGGLPDGGAPDCAGVVCPPGHECAAEGCVRADECVQVRCPERGTVCSHRECVAETADEDRDGSPAAEDCDDRDPEVLAGSVRPCRTGCGDGTTTCVHGEWQRCTEPEQCTCEPGAVDTEDCGRCGSSTRRCGDDGAWEPLGPCKDEGECIAGTVGVGDCADGTPCGVQTRICEDDCRWGPWGGCEQGIVQCAPGDVDARSCGECGTEERVCTDDCRWAPYGECGEEGCECDPDACATYGAICCQGVPDCVDWTSDEANCGGCGVACPPAEHCVFDARTATAGCADCDPAACGAFGAICCPTVDGCVDWTSDEANCGGCGVACAGRDRCVFDARTASAGCVDCDPDACGVFGAICCPTVDGCVDWTSDEANCGGCGVACGLGQQCVFDAHAATADCAG